MLTDLHARDHQPDFFFQVSTLIRAKPAYDNGLKYPKRKTAQASVATKTFGILSKFADINILMYLV